MKMLCNTSQETRSSATKVPNFRIENDTALQYPTRKCFKAGRKKNGLPLSMFPFLGSLPQTTNLIVCVCGGEGGKLPNALVVYLKLPIW